MLEQEKRVIYHFKLSCERLRGGYRAIVLFIGVFGVFIGVMKDQRMVSARLRVQQEKKMGVYKFTENEIFGVLLNTRDLIHLSFPKIR